MARSFRFEKTRGALKFAAARFFYDVTASPRRAPRYILWWEASPPTDVSFDRSAAPAADGDSRTPSKDLIRGPHGYHLPIRPVPADRARQLEDAAAAIDVLNRGHDRYITIVTQVHKELVGGHSTGQVVIPSDPLALGLPLWSGAPPVQTPFALVLGCSDARVPIEQIFDQSPNDLFVIRVAGNVLGVECLGSIDYAVNQFGDSLKLLVVLGHSTCGAVSAAVDSYLEPKDYASIAFTHALRSLVDRIQVAVRGAATALERVAGMSVARHPSYRAALVETAVYLTRPSQPSTSAASSNRLTSNATRVVYGVFDLVEQRVRGRPAAPEAKAPCRCRSSPTSPAVRTTSSRSAPRSPAPSPPLSSRPARRAIRPDRGRARASAGCPARCWASADSGISAFVRADIRAAWAVARDPAAARSPRSPCRRRRARAGYRCIRRPVAAAPAPTKPSLRVNTCAEH